MDEDEYAAYAALPIEEYGMQDNRCHEHNGARKENPADERFC